MYFKIEKIGQEEFPPQLLEIPQVPESLHIVGAPLDRAAPYLAIVGSRTCTTYGKDVCEKLIAGLAGSGIVIVSGLALGTDSNAHRSAMKHGLKTIAFPGSGLSEKVLYPAANLSLAKEILASGGTLVSELGSDVRAQEWTFPQRNRLMAGLCKAVLIIEAADKSGTLITARLALDYNREVLAVPGPITSDTSFGCNRLIRQGATVITTSDEILEVFGITPERGAAPPPPPRSLSTSPPKKNNSSNSSPNPVLTKTSPTNSTSPLINSTSSSRQWKSKAS